MGTQRGSGRAWTTAWSQRLLSFSDRPGSGGGGGEGWGGETCKLLLNGGSVALTSRMPRLLSSLSSGSTFPVRNV